LHVNCIHDGTPSRRGCSEPRPAKAEENGYFHNEAQTADIPLAERPPF
jgi:hypothetical protein